MRISHRYRFIFFANPKTGSSSVRELLNPYTDVMPVPYRKRTAANPFYPHITPRETRQLFEGFGWDFDSYSGFVFVRNPWARLVSLYEMISAGKPAHFPFSDWLYTVKPYGAGGGGAEWERWRKYGAWSIEHFIKDDSGNVLVDEVIRLEDIHVALKPFLARLKLPGIDVEKIPYINKREAARNYTSYYTADTAEYVGNLYRYDVETYGYRFGE